MLKALTMVGPITLATVAILLPTSGRAQEKPQPQATTPQQISANAAVYKPPLRGAPKGRIGGGSRGVGTETIVLSVLAPDDAGHTTSEQPSLYWHISTPTTYPVELTIMDPRRVEPVLEMRVAGPIAAGLHRVRLSDHGVTLDPDVPYRWYVSVVLDNDRRAKDVLAGGMIERVSPSPELLQRLAQAPKEQVPSIYASDGLWYDAMTAASDLLDATPANPALRRERAALLSQVGLREIRE